MPLFEYQCALGHVTEVLYGKWSPELELEQVNCSTCGMRASKQWSAPRFNLEFPAQLGGVHSMAGAGKRARFRQGD